MKNKRFASLFLASMMALQLATPLAAREVETQATAEDTDNSTFNGSARTGTAPTITDLILKETFDDAESTGALDLATYFDVVPDDVDNPTAYYLARKSGITDPVADSTGAYTFQGWKDSSDGDWEFATYDGDNNIVVGSATPVEVGTTITAVWEEKEVKNFAITALENNYFQDQILDLSSFRFTVNYDNSTSTENVPYSDDFVFTVGSASGTTFDVTTPLKKGEHENLYITYGGYDFSIQLTIQVKTLESIAVIKNPKTSYTVGEYFDPAGLEITRVYETDDQPSSLILGYFENISAQYFSFSPDSQTPLTENDKTITITYTDPDIKQSKSVDLTITVEDSTPSQHTVNFYDDKDGNKLGDSLTVTSGDTIDNIAFTPPTKTGYTFAGWFYNDGTEKTFTLGTTTVTSDMEIYAKWTGLTVKTIALKKDPTTTKYTVGENFDPTGLEITVIFTDDSTAIVAYADDPDAFSFNPQLVTTLQWGDKEVVVTYKGQTLSIPIEVDYDANTTTYTVKYNLDGGNIDGANTLPERKVAKDETVSTVGTPVQEGFTFTGWTYIGTDEQERLFEFGKTPVVGNITIYANWLSNSDVASFTIATAPKSIYTDGDSYDPTGLIIKITSAAGTEFTIKYDEVPDAFSFSPTLDSVLSYSAEKVPIAITYGGYTENHEVTVNKKVFTIKFNTQQGYINGSDKVTEQTATDGSTDVFNPGNPTRNNYNFIYWYYTDAEGEEQEFFFKQTVVTSDMTLYAKWEEKSNPAVSAEISRFPDSLNYTEGENFNPSGLAMVITYEDGTEATVSYNSTTAEDFSFSPALTTALTLEDSKVTFTYLDYSVEFSIDITVKEDDRWVTGFVRDHQEEVVNGAILSFRQNNVEIYNTSTNGSGLYEIQNLEAGTYTLVATYGNRTASSIVILTGYSQNLATIYLPRAQSSTNIIANSVVPFVQVSNMDAVAEELSTGESADTLISIDLEITSNYPPSDVEYMEAYKGTNEVLGAFFDMSLYKSLVFSEESNTGRMPIAEIATLMEITLDLPAATQGKGTYYVYRMHNGELQKLSSVANEFGEKIQVNSAKDQIVITTRRFSTYAIAYKEVSDSEDDNYYDGYVGSDRYTITTNKIVNGEATNADIGGSIYLSTTYPIHNTKVNVSLTPYLGFVVDYVTATDAYGNNVSVYLENGEYTFNQGGSEVTLTVAFRNLPIPTSPDGYTGFYDVNEEDWFYLTVLTAANLELMVGKGYGVFEPNATTTRAEIVQVLYNLAGSPQVSTISTFSDVLGYEWYYHAVNWAQSIGLVEGYGDQTFRPNQAITREELSSLFFAYAQTDPSITPILWPFTVEYSDHDFISPWALESVRWCTNKGLFSGKTGNFFGPQDAATRAEVAHCLLAITDRAVL